MKYMIGREDGAGLALIGDYEKNVVRGGCCVIRCRDAGRLRRQ
jgi:hypothetical protein